MPRTILTDRDFGEAFNSAIERDCNSLLVEVMRKLKADYNITMSSAYLMMVLRLVNHLQFLNAADTAAFLRSLIDIAAAGDDEAGRAAADAEYARSHAALIDALELLTAESGGNA